MQTIAGAHAQAIAGSTEARALNQAARSLLLAQASDWAFIMKTGTAVEYAQGRIRDHLARFHFLADAVERGEVDEQRLAALEAMDNIFPEIDFRIYA
jgi:1,4-alpha-glucan branching enzyme